MTPPYEALGELAAILRMRGRRPFGAPTKGPFADERMIDAGTIGDAIDDGMVDSGMLDDERELHRGPGRGSGVAGDPSVDDLLLCRRMRALRLDPDELYCSEPRAFGVLRKLCATCSVPGRCARDLADEFADPAWQDWRNYCPNATTLSILSALRACGPYEMDLSVR